MSETGSVKELMEKERQRQQKNQEEMIEMREYPHTSGSFTLPGEVGCEELTLKLAEKWGADVIRDSDGTKLSDEIINAGYGIYSTICIIRDHNEWAKKHRNMLQQTFLMSEPATARGEQLEIHPLDGYFKEQFQINDSEESLEFWQVFDRTENREISKEQWSYCRQSGAVTITGTEEFHQYTVNFLAYRIWEEINMYNHVTNHWNKEHLMPVDPRYPEAREYLLSWMKNWCEENPDTTVVRFTSLFYNFVWIWGENERHRNHFTDWGSYDFTVSPLALKQFEKEYGYALTSEDFISQGKLHATHMAPGKKQLDYMKFTNQFVISFGKQLVDLVHSYGKKAYVFYDDSWVGLEPYFPTFPEFGFDGIIKCIFSGYEVRLCAGVDTPVHEVRLHPYLFPVGLGGAPTFSEGGDPKRDAQKYWVAARRAMLRAKIDRIGLGGYLHLLEEYPDFVDYIEEVADEFRTLKALHQEGSPETLNFRIGVLTAWGKTRSWTLSGHFHETWQNDLIHINEAMSGWPVNVDYLDFEDVKNKDLSGYDVIINAGFAGSAWSGAEYWKDSKAVTALCSYAWNGGCILGVNQPSMTDGFTTNFQLADVLGVDQDMGERCCHGRIAYEKQEKILDSMEVFAKSGSGKTAKEIAGDFQETAGIYLTDPATEVLAETVAYSPIGEEVHTPKLTIHSYGKGCGIYLSHFVYGVENSRFLLELLLKAAGKESAVQQLGDNPCCETAYFPRSGKAVAVNNSGQVQNLHVTVGGVNKEVELKPYSSKLMEVSI